mgnify:CR=1 FL=1
MPAPERSHEDAVDSRTSWSIVLVGFLLLSILWGSIFTFTVYAGELAAAFGLTGFQTSGVFSFGTAAFFIVGGSVGILVARVPLRPVVGAAGLAIAGSVLLLQVVGSYAGLLAAFALYGLAGGTIFVLTLSLVPQWFDRYQGTAMGLTVTGNGIGVQVFPFVWLWLFERTSIQRAFLVVGGAAALVVLAATVVYRRPPWVRGGETVAVDLAWVRSLLANPRFVAAWVGLVLGWAWYFLLSAGLVDVLTEAGIARSLAATAFGLVGGVSVASRVASGALADRIGARETLVSGVALAALGLVVLAFTTAPTSMYLALVTFGAGLGAIAALYSPVVIRAFDPENATAVTGIFTYCSAVAGFLTPLGINGLYRATGGYDLPLLVLAALTFVGAGLFYWGTDPAA